MAYVKDRLQVSDIKKALGKDLHDDVMKAEFIMNKWRNLVMDAGLDKNKRGLSFALSMGDMLWLLTRCPFDLQARSSTSLLRDWHMTCAHVFREWGMKSRALGVMPKKPLTRLQRAQRKPSTQLCFCVR